MKCQLLRQLTPRREAPIRRPPSNTTDSSPLATETRPWPRPVPRGLTPSVEILWKRGLTPSRLTASLHRARPVSSGAFQEVDDGCFPRGETAAWAFHGAGHCVAGEEAVHDGRMDVALAADRAGVAELLGDAADGLVQHAL